ncbi:MAG: non-canonical purine NTP pyrophosphatase [Propionibacteriaceae bacterium]|jgi:XTP/dITP diphosphohydrolase|nr:non-canonical purine NTP pyrophosphatase [Propionibacteriaceae bacterium]
MGAGDPMMLLLATSSAHKIVEMTRMLAREGVPVTVVGRGDVVSYPEPVEDGATFEANALLKARAGFAATGVVTLADDSGLEVDVLNQMPGVRSARWAGGHGDDAENLALLLRQIDDVEPARRTARFVCAMALVWGQPTDDDQAHRRHEVVLRGVVEGRLTTSPRGEHGFGYDPVFVPNGFTATTAEMSDEDKDDLSHRGRALRAITPWIRSLADRVSATRRGQIEPVFAPVASSEGVADETVS